MHAVSASATVYASSDAPFWTVGTDEKKAHHAVRSNLPRFRLLGSASNIL